MTVNGGVGRCQGVSAFSTQRYHVFYLLINQLEKMGDRLFLNYARKNEYERITDNSNLITEPK